MKIGVLGTGFGMVHLQTFQNHPLVNELVFFSRFAPARRFLREKIKSGEYGRLLSLQVVNRCAPVWGPVPLGLDVLPLESCSCDFDWLSWCLGELTLSGVNAIEVERRAACIDMLLTGPARLPIQMTCSTLMPLAYGVRKRIEATFERAAVEYRETSWSQGSNAAEMVVYDTEGARTIALPQADSYYDSLTYSLERIRDGQQGITDLQEALPALRLALELGQRIPFCTRHHGNFCCFV